MFKDNPNHIMLQTTAAIHGETVAGESSKIRKTLEGLISTLDKSTFDVAELLHTVKSKNYYQGWGFNTFQEYTSTLKLKQRKAQYLTRIVDVMSTVGIARTQYEPLGIARLREITSLDPEKKWTNPETNQEIPMKDFIAGFVEKGEAIEMDDLKKNVRTLKGFVGDNDLVFVNLCITRSVHDNTYRPALEKAKMLIGSVGKDDEGISQDASDGAAIEVALAEFLTSETAVQNQAYELETIKEVKGFDLADEESYEEGNHDESD